MATHTHPVITDLDPSLWRAGQHSHVRPVLATGHAALDTALADGGWPRGALNELLSAAPGIGEMPLLLPALAALVRNGGWLVLVSPPFTPNVGAWQAAGIDPRRLLLLTPPDARSWLWSAEQAARTAGCAVLAWQGRYPLAMRELRRLQLAAQEGGNLVALLRPAAARTQSSPAALRLALTARARGGVTVEIVKQRGGFGGNLVTLDLHAAHALRRIPPWQLPVHQPAHFSTPTHHEKTNAEEMPRALAGDQLSRTAAGTVDTQRLLSPGNGQP